MIRKRKYFKLWSPQYIKCNDAECEDLEYEYDDSHNMIFYCKRDMKVCELGDR